MTAARQDGGAGMTEAQKRALLRLPADGSRVFIRDLDIIAFRALHDMRNARSPLIARGGPMEYEAFYYLTPAGIAARARIGGE